MKQDRPTGLITANGAPITSRDVSRARAEASLSVGRSNEAAERKGTFMANWRPGLRSADADWLFDRNDVVARARDASRNDVVGASAGNRKVNRAVGSGWRLASRVSARALGITQAQALDLRNQIDTEFRLYAYGAGFQSDAERKKTFGQNLRLGASHFFHDGEACATIEWAQDEPTKYKTRLRIVDPDRLSNPDGRPDDDLLRGGVQRDRYGRVTGYWFREGHPNDMGSLKGSVWKYWPRFSTPLGRSQVIHAFDEKRAGQSRGVSAFVSVLKSLRGLNKFKDSTVEAATINALMVAFVKSSAGPAAVSESFSADDLQDYGTDREDFYKDNPVNLAGAQIPVLPMGDEIEMQNSARDTTGFDSFTRAILRLIAAALGLTYEELSMDFSQTNYSSARAALAIAWDETLAFRGVLQHQFASPFFVAWLEEAFDIGAIKLPPFAPDFYAAIEAYSECRWIGPGRGWIDPTKEIDAAAARVEAQQSTLEDECADNGKDWEEVLEQLAYEKQRRGELGIPTVDTGLRNSSPDLTEAEAAREADARPGGTALQAVRRTARSSEHAAFLDARPN